MLSMLLLMLAVGWVDTVKAQPISVAKFEFTPFDLSAASHETHDATGRACALLKVLILSHDIGFESDNLVRFEDKGDNEYWLWLSPGAQSISIHAGNLQPLQVMFAEHDPEHATLKSNYTYSLQLKVGMESSGMVAITFLSNASSFDLEIDGYHTDPNQRTFPIKQGNHKIFARAMGFEDYEGQLVVNVLSQNDTYNIQMTPTPTDPLEQVALADQYVKIKKYERARELYTLAARQGCAQGQNGIGDMYRYGRGVDKDFGKAVKWYKKAEKQGYTTAMINLGDLYHYGEFDKIYKEDWYLQYFKAARAGDAEGWYKLITETFYGPRKKREFMLNGALMGHAGCQRELGLEYLKAKDTFQNDAKAFKWLLIAAHAGDAIAQQGLGSMYINGRGVPKDTVTGFKWYEKAALGGNELAAFQVALFYDEGILIPQDLDLAIFWYRFSLRRLGNWNNKARQRLNALEIEKSHEIIKDYLK